MATSRQSGVVDIQTPYGLARVNASGQVLWAEWEVWRHCEELVQSGAWSSRESTTRGRQRQVFFLTGKASEYAVSSIANAG